MLTALWLIWVLSSQISSFQLILVLLGISLIVFFYWLNQLNITSTTGKRFRVFVYLFIFVSIFLTLPTQNISTQENPNGFSEAELNKKLEQGPVFLNFTADWCITCKVNERVALKTKNTLNLFKEKEIFYMEADWTNKNIVFVGDSFTAGFEVKDSEHYVSRLSKKCISKGLIINGGVTAHDTHMASANAVRILKEFNFSVSHHLCSANNDFDLHEIKKITSHPQVFGQCNNWIRNNLPDVEKVVATSTAEAASKAVHDNEFFCIANSYAIELFNLHTHLENIQDSNCLLYTSPSPRDS